MTFENFPYTNFHEINLDWIVAKVKEAYSASNPPDYPVKSVNGMTGDVIIAIPANLVQSVNGETGDVVLYRNPLTQFPATDEVRWNLFRICDGDERGIEFDEDGAHRIEGTRRILIYDEENQPDFPVTSVNGQTGDVQITAGVQSVNGKTGNVVTPFVNPNTDILALDSNSPSGLWGISRNVAGGNVALYITTGGTNPQAFIRFIPDGGQAINLPLLTNVDIPESAGVVSVNTKTGAVTLYGTDIKINSSTDVSISDQLSINEQNIDSILTLISTRESNTSWWENKGRVPTTGVSFQTNMRLSTINYIPENCMRITTNNNNIILQMSAWDSNNTYIGLYKVSNEFQPTGDNIKLFKSIDFSVFRSIYPGYKYKLTAYHLDNTEINISEAEYIIFDFSKLISIEENETIISNNITALQAKDDIHDQQISALQRADTTHDQQISALQSADTTHDQQISALQSADTNHTQQIAELYTRASVYVVSIPNANTLPLRYPASGTDEKIKATNKVVSMDFSMPGAQVSNWTITTYDGYLEISGTINGGTDITLYLA